MKFKALDVVKDKTTGMYYIVVTGKVYTYNTGVKQIYLAVVNENRHVKLNPAKLRKINKSKDNLFIATDATIYNYFIKDNFLFGYPANSDEKPKPISRSKLISILA